jgi:hypothetical protein
MALDPLAILKTRRLALEAFVKDSYDYLDSEFEQYTPTMERKYFSWETRRVAKEINGISYEYEFPELGGPGKSHTQHCAKAPQYGVRKEDLFLESVSPKERLGLKLAAAVFESNTTLRNLIGSHKNFWRQYLSILGFETDPADRKLRDRYSSRDVRDQLDYLDPGLSETVLEATRADDLDSQGWVPSSDAGWETFGKEDDARLERFLDYLNMFRDECEHVESLTCGLCGITFTPTSETYIYLRVGGHYCAFCVDAAVDSENELFYLEFEELKLDEILDLGLACQSSDPDDVVMEISTRNPVNEVKGELIRAGLNEMDPGEAVSRLAKIAARPRQSLTERLGSSIEEWAFNKSGFTTTGNLGADGHYCQSSGELEICNYLTNRGINHSMHPYYRDLVADDKVLVWRYRGDLRIEDSIIEFFGLSDAEYKRRSGAKVTMGRYLGIEIIEVRPKDLKNLDLVFHKFLSEGEESPFLF